jgi:hypothetical protein
MTDPDAGDRTPDEATPGQDHDATEGGPSFNAPGDEPDADSSTQQKQGDAGRLTGKDL